jgi:chromosome segregation ATPase
MSIDLITLDTSSLHDVSPTTLLNMRFLQTRIDHLRIKLEHHQERYNALEQKEAELTLKMLKHDETGLYHFYLAAERVKTREALEKTRAKLKDLKKNLDELLKN